MPTMRYDPSMTDWDSNYWRLRIADGLVHLNKRGTRMQDPRCGVYEAITSSPGTIGPETMVTCMRCLGSR